MSEEARSRHRIAVVGGGIGGLAVARALHVRLAGTAEIAVFEASPRFGGNVGTVEERGFRYDIAGDSWVRAKPEAETLARELGLASELATPPPEGRGVFVLARRVLHPMPDGIFLGIPTSSAALARTRLLSRHASLRATLEPRVPVRVFEGDDDESVLGFFARRFGDGYARGIAGPLLGGISAGDASVLSIRAAFPQLVAMEAASGSLVRAAKAARATRPGGIDASPFLGLARGMGTLVDALVRDLGSRGVELRPSSPVEHVTPRGDTGFAIAGEPFDAVVATGPLPGSAARLRPVAPDLADAMDALVDMSSAAIVVLGLERSWVKHPLHSSGFIVSHDEPVRLLASTFISTKWPGRAPDNRVLVRVFYGGARDQAVLDRSDEDLAALARKELGAILGFESSPLFARVHRFTGSSPQMKVGYPARKRRYEAALGLPDDGSASPAHPSLRPSSPLLPPVARVARVARVAIVGAGVSGVGISDVVRQANAAAERIEAGLRARARLETR